MPRDPDFEKIYQAFMWRYCQGQGECEEGKRIYYAWLAKMGLDDAKPYVKPQEKFSWAQSFIRFLKQDETRRYYQVEAVFPLSSMNRNVYTRDELVQAARSLRHKPVNLNHASARSAELAQALSEVAIEAAQFEDDAVEVVLSCPKEGIIAKMIDDEKIVHVSIEADCIEGIEPTTDGLICKGLSFTGLALLEQNVLPGVPLTRIMPIEKIVESFTVLKVNEVNEKQEEKDTPTEKQKPTENALALEKDQLVPTEASTENDHAKEKVEQKEPSPCEKAAQALLIRVEALEKEFAELKKTKEAVVPEHQRQPSPPEILTKEGFWTRFHQLRSEGLSKSDAFRLVSLELLKTVNKQPR